MSNSNLTVLIKNYFTVIQELDTIKILAVSLLPKTFNEAAPSKIVSSFFEYVETDEARTVQTQSINERYEANYYDSIYKIYHDLTVITLILLSKFKAGDASYVKIDNYYKFSVQLLISESERLQLKISNIDEEEKSAPLTDLELKLSDEYALITSSYKEANSEALFVMGNKNTALFSSLLQKSSLDQRDLGIEHPFIKSTVLPQVEQLQTPVNTLGNLSPLIPTQNTASEEISSDLFHPNWFGLAISSWLRPSLKSVDLSFLPSVNGSKTVVSNELKGLTWLQQVGFKELAKLEKDVEPEVEETKDVEMADVEEKPEVEKDELEKPETEETEKIETNGEKTEESTESNGEKKEDTTESNGEKKEQVTESNGEKKEITTETNAEKIEEPPREKKTLDLQNMLEYDPAVDEEELISSLVEEFPTSSKQIQLKINKFLMQLNKLSQVPVRDLELEKKIYFKIEKLLQFLVLKNDVTPNLLQLPISFKIPVTQNNYAGSLPGPLLGTMSSQSSYHGNGASMRSGANGFRSNRLSSINKKYRR